MSYPNFYNICKRQLAKTCTFQCSKYFFHETKSLLLESHITICCKRPAYNYYIGQQYHKFDEIPLTSKGWNSSKSKGDYFIIHPNLAVCNDIFERSLADLPIKRNLLECLHKHHITKVTKFQEDAFLTLTERRNAILAAETGCGKTLAYLLPILNNISSANEMNTPQALIVVPNRELAYQIEEVVQSLTESIGLKQKVIVGGRTKKSMLNPECDKIDLLIGTPGALSKLTNVGIYCLRNVLFTVFDEADTLIDDSFIDRIAGIIKHIPQSQLSLVSATMPKKLPPILESYEQTFVSITTAMLHKPRQNITQRFLRLTKSTKPSQILLIAKSAKQPLIIFTNRNDTCHWLSKFLQENNLKCAQLNGNMNYAIRIHEWNKFFTGKINILVTTDVCSRGLDTTTVTHVVNYDFPHYAADYLHRIGRIGRIGSPTHCKVTNFISGPEEICLVQKIELSIRRNEPIPNVDGNITRLIQNKIIRQMRQDVML